MPVRRYYSIEVRNDGGLNEDGGNGDGREYQNQDNFVGELKLADKLEVGVNEQSQG